MIQFLRDHRKLLMVSGALLVIAALEAQTNAMTGGVAFLNGGIFIIGVNIFSAGLVACFLKSPPTS